MKQLHVVKNKNKKKILIPAKFSEIKNDKWLGYNGEPINSKHMLISMLLPPAVKAFYDELESEVESVCGERYTRGTASQRWGSQRGSIVFADQKIAIEKPRVRDAKTKKEIELETYKKFQDTELFDEKVFNEGLKHVSQRDYTVGMQKIGSSFGLSKSSVSRSWIKSTKKQVEKLLNRDLKPLNIIAIFIDGKRFQEIGVVVALGITEDGKKYVLGIYQCSTENSNACKNLLETLDKRGLPERELLFIVDGGSGLNKALKEKYQVDDPENRRAVKVRCYKHKWENLRSNLDEKQQEEIKPLFNAVRSAKDMTMAIVCNDALEAALKKYNRSAFDSYIEAKNDLLIIHSLGLNARLKRFFSTTNAIESLNSLLEEDLRRVKNWENSEHFQRWLATSCLRNEKRMHRVEGYLGFPALKVHLQKLCNKKEEEMFDNFTAAA